MTKTNDRLIIELASRGLSNYKIGDLVGVSEATVRRALERTGYKAHLLPLDLNEQYKFELETPIELVDEDCMVTADWHSPMFNPYLVNQMIERAVSENIKTLLIGGDLFNMDHLSAYEPKQNDAGVVREVETTNNVLRTLNEWFDRIIVIWGNHDYRFTKALGYKMAFDQSMRLLFGELGATINDKIELSNLDHMMIRFTDTEPHRQAWRLCHPATYSRVPLSTPTKLASKYNTNIICAHAHHAAVGFAPDGIKTVAEIGGLFNQAATAYLQRTTTYPCWTPGYGWFKNGRFRLTTPVWDI